MAADVKSLAFAIVCVALLAVFPACRAVEESSSQPTPDNPTASPEPSVEAPDGATLSTGDCVRISDPPTDDSYNPALSLRRLVEWHNAVVTADVIAERGVYYLYGDIPYTIYTIKTSQVIAGANLPPGDEVQFLVPGGPRPGGGCIEPLYGPINVGDRYLIFLTDWRSVIPDFPGFGGEAAARFKLSSDGFVVPNGFEGYPGTGDITGATPEQVKEALAADNPQRSLEALATVKLDDAIAKIEAVIAEAPLPDWPPPWSALYQNTIALATPSPAAPPTPAAETPVASPEPSSTPTPFASTAP